MRNTSRHGSQSYPASIRALHRCTWMPERIWNFFCLHEGHLVTIMTVISFRKLDSCALFILNFLSQEPETRDKEVVASKLFYFSEKFCCRSGLSVADVTISTVVGMTGLIHASAVHSPVARFESAWFVPVVWSRFMLASVSGPNGLQIWLIRNFSFQNEIVLNLHAILVFLLHNLYAILLKWTF